MLLTQIITFQWRSVRFTFFSKKGGKLKMKNISRKKKFDHFSTNHLSVCLTSFLSFYQHNYYAINLHNMESPYTNRYAKHWSWNIHVFSTMMDWLWKNLEKKIQKSFKWKHGNKMQLVWSGWILVVVVPLSTKKKQKLYSITKISKCRCEDSGKATCFQLMFYLKVNISSTPNNLNSINNSWWNIFNFGALKKRCLSLSFWSNHIYPFHIYIFETYANDEMKKMMISSFSFSFSLFSLVVFSDSNCRFNSLIKLNLWQ